MESPGQKVMLITSCSSGIGLKMAVMLAKDEQKRYHVIVTMRDLKRRDKLVEAAGDAYGKTLSLAVLDVCSDESVKQCINGIIDRRVDVIINNAGIGLVGPVESIPIEQIKKVFESLGGSDIIVVSSVMGLQRVVFNDVYAASKFAMEGFCESLAVQLLKLSLIEPGPKEYPGADADTVHYFKNVYLPSSLDIFETLGQTPDDICTKKVIEASSPRFRNLTNPLHMPIVALKYANETGGLSVHAFYHMLFNLGTPMHVSMTAMKYLTCECLSLVSPPVS
uniref:Retinol dehydrogenase 8b n=1 Tax=Acanthochromis polyacanthus TaxID=80966 RepID=A0A3Q1FF24_9TELE